MYYDPKVTVSEFLALISTQKAKDIYKEDFYRIFNCYMSQSDFLGENIHSYKT